MDTKCLFWIIGYFGLFWPTKANFAFQSGPMLFDPYSSFFGNHELSPFASNGIQVAMTRDGFPKGMPLGMPNGYAFSHMNKPSKDYYRDMKSKPIDWKKFAVNYDPKGLYGKSQPKRSYEKMLSSVPPMSRYNHKALIRPKPETDVNIKPYFPYQTNHFNSNPLFNYKDMDYKNSNTFRPPVPGKSFFDKSYSKKDKIRATDLYNSPMGFDVEMDKEDDEEDNDSEIMSRHKGMPNKVRYLPPPNHLTTTYRPNNFLIKDRLLSSDSRFKRPALYEIDPPKNLNRNGPAFIQKIPVPQQTLVEIADISEPKSTINSRPHPFEGFHQNTKSKPESEIIVNALTDGMTTARQVGASMTVQLDHRNVETKGKIFDEPLGNIDRRNENNYRNNDLIKKKFHSYSHKPFRPNNRNPFNYRHFETFSDQKSVNSQPNDYNKQNDNSYESSNSDIDYGHNRDNYREESNEYSKPRNNYLSESHNKRPHFEPLIDTEPQRPQTLEESDAEKRDEDPEDWSSNGIPGTPGKDYPMLSGVPTRSRFSCMGRPHGFYADVSQKCQVYHQCSTQGQQRFLCPNGTLFNQESLVCEWWYNVYCENSEQLYHKNADLYRTDSKQNKENSNDEDSNDETNNQTNNGYNKMWRNGNNNGEHNHRTRSHNHNTHNHKNDFNSKYRVGSDRKDLIHSSGPKLEYDDHIDVDLNNEETIKTIQKTVSNWKPVNRGKDLVFIS